MTCQAETIYCIDRRVTLSSCRSMIFSIAEPVSLAVSKDDRVSTTVIPLHRHCPGHLRRSDNEDGLITNKSTPEGRSSPF